LTYLSSSSRSLSLSTPPPHLYPSHSLGSPPAAETRTLTCTGTGAGGWGVQWTINKHKFAFLVRGDLILKRSLTTSCDHHIQYAITRHINEKLLFVDCSTSPCLHSHLHTFDKTSSLPPRPLAHLSLTSFPSLSPIVIATLTDPHLPPSAYRV
jgi:hypothetical protein